MHKNCIKISCMTLDQSLICISGSRCDACIEQIAWNVHSRTANHWSSRQTKTPMSPCDHADQTAQGDLARAVKRERDATRTSSTSFGLQAMEGPDLQELHPFDSESQEYSRNRRDWSSTDPSLRSCALLLTHVSLISIWGCLEPECLKTR